jgi:DNA polymerase III epsilon subunit-like protein
LFGWEQAREEVWKLIDANTIIIGHALHHDLDILRMIHTRIIDSALLVQAAVNVPNRQWGLQTLCEQLIHLRIRNNPGKVHSCLEDVLATREVVLWCTQNSEELANWASERRIEEKRKIKEREAARQRKRDEKNAASGSGKYAKYKKSGNTASNGEYSDYDSDREVIQWADIAEDIG